MGTYLSTPVTEKCEEKGGNGQVDWGVVDMQGWRKSMEDAHIAHTPQDCSEGEPLVFGVFDGHGGAEVARFCQLYLVSLLKLHYAEQEVKDWGLALRQSFHSLDRMIGDNVRRDEIIRLRTEKPSPGEQKSVKEIPPLFPQPVEEEQEGSPPPPALDIAADEDKEQKSDEEADDDSTEAVGKEEAADLDHITDDEDVAPFNDDDVDGEPERTSSLFQRFLTLSGTLSTGSSTTKSAQNSQTSGTMSMSVATSTPPPTPFESPSSTKPAIMQNGRWVCNLPDHPIHAGATAIVAVLCDDVLTVANAGDSRAVLCRGGDTVALSEDHKPSQDRELERIKGAGGFVNQFGRVNGNLNLSRSIGDLKYKQVDGINPEDQMITAEPDIMSIAIKPEDEFIILGCDGIWDCLTNEKAVEFVRSRIGEKDIIDIGKEMLDTIISVDPRVTQGIGGDNMTIMIIDLQPDTRNRYPTGLVAGEEAVHGESTAEISDHTIKEPNNE